MKLINVSDIANYVVCPTKIYYKLVLGKREKFNEALAFGKIKHKFMEEINKVEEKIFCEIRKDEKFENIERRFEEKYNEIFDKIVEKYGSIIDKFSLKEKIENELGKIKKEEIKIKARLARKFVKLGFYGSELWQVVMPKFISEVEVRSFVLGLKGRIDKIRIDNDGFFPYEIKSRAYSNKIWLSEKLQLTGYALLMERKFKTNIDYGFLKFKDKVVKINIRNSLREKLLELKDEINEMIKNKSMPEVKEKAICKNCSFRNLCFNSLN